MASMNDLGYRSLVIFFISVLFHSSVAIETCELELREEKPVIESKGNGTVVGLFDLHSSQADCIEASSLTHSNVRDKKLSPAATQRLLAAVWALEWLNERDILADGTIIGLNAFSSCTDIKVGLQKTIHSLSSLGILDKCNNTSEKRLIGYLGPADQEISSAVSRLLTSFKVFHESLHVNSLDTEIKALAEVLKHLEWAQVALIADNKKIQESFHEAASLKGICISQSFSLKNHDNYTDIYGKIKDSGAKVVIFLGLDFQLKRALQESLKHVELTKLYWVVAGPTVYTGYKLFDDLPVDHQRIFFLQSTQSKVPGFEDYLQSIPTSVQINDPEVERLIKECYSSSSSSSTGEPHHQVSPHHPVSPPLLSQPTLPEDEESDGASGAVDDDVLPDTNEDGNNGYSKRAVNEERSYCAPILSNDVIAVAEAVAKLTEHFRLGRNNSCLSVNNVTEECESYADSYLFQVPQLMSDQLNISVMAYQVGPQSKMRFVEVGLYSNGSLILKTEDLGILHDQGGGWFKVPRFRCPLCPCINDPDRSESSLIDFWRVEPWVATCGTLAAIGCVAALVLGIFILVRLCSGDSMEGSQALAFLLLFGILVTYFSVVPFMLDASPITCNVRPIGAGLAYALLFCPILARCLMLATSDPDGLLGHVSGLIQTSLFFFMILVQAALGVQQWWVMSGPGTGHPPHHSRYDGIGCLVSDIDYGMALCYVSFLLAVLLLLTPFCVKNRRNYREGLCFFLATLATIGVWAGWLSAFFLLDPEWKQPVICLGLVATATVILLIVYVPRVVKMVRSITLDTMNTSGNIEQCGNGPSITDITMRTSNAMIYETVNHAYAPEPILIGGDGRVVKSAGSTLFDRQSQQNQSQTIMTPPGSRGGDNNSETKANGKFPSDSKFPSQSKFPPPSKFPSDPKFPSDNKFPSDPKFPPEPKFPSNNKFPSDSKFPSDNKFPSDPRFPSDPKLPPDPKFASDPKFPPPEDDEKVINGKEEAPGYGTVQRKPPTVTHL